MKMNRVVIAGLAVLLASSGVLAQGRGGRGQQQAQTPPPTTAAAGDQARRVPPPEEKSSVTKHSAKIGGQMINYTATAGTYVIKDDTGEAKTTFFYVAYTKDGVDDASKRPVAFSYNGGPEIGRAHV